MLPGTKLGPYEIIEPVGRGGMGEVYRAHDARLRRKVAIKTMASRALADPDMRERFDREARAVAALSHPNILAIYDVGDHEGIPYIAIELLDGDTLRSHLGTSPLPLSTALDELERAYAAGWRDGRTLAIDPFFTAVRSEPRFTQLLSRIQSDVAAMRARADYSGLP
jgi:hypothetical protein